MLNKKVGVVVVGLLAIGCSKKSNDKPAPASAHRATECELIPIADFQALLTEKVERIDGSLVGACNAFVAKRADGDSLGVAAMIYVNDPDNPYKEGADRKPLAGIGDKASWRGDGDVRVEAQKGTAVCFIGQPSQSSTLKPNASDAEKAAYAQLLGTVCNDVFAAQATSHTLEHFKGGSTN